MPKLKLTDFNKHPLRKPDNVDGRILTKSYYFEPFHQGIEIVIIKDKSSETWDSMQSIIAYKVKSKDQLELVTDAIKRYFDRKYSPGYFDYELQVIFVEFHSGSLATLLHELVHFVTYTFHHRAIPISRDNDEVLAYSLDYLFNLILKDFFSGEPTINFNSKP